MPFWAACAFLLHIIGFVALPLAIVAVGRARTCSNNRTDEVGPVPGFQLFGCYNWGNRMRRKRPDCADSPSMVLLL